MQRPRFRIQTLMIVVASGALLCGALIECGRRRQRFMRAYRAHALAEIENGVKASVLSLNVGSAANIGGDPASHSAVVSMWKLDAEESRLLEASNEDRLTVMRDAGWKTPKDVPLHIDMNETMSEGGLGRLLRTEDYHRRMRKKYQRAARHPWLPVPSDPPPPK